MCHQLSLLTSDTTSETVSDADLLDRITRYELDHEHPERGGATEPDNLGPLCRRHHRIKTAGNFTVQTLTPGQSVQWTSRQTGRTYHVHHAHDYRPDSGATAA